MSVFIPAMFLSAMIPSVACTCAAKRTVADEFRAADAVFAGRVESVRPADEEARHGRTIVTFAIWRGYKAVQRETVVLKGWATSDCSFPFKSRKYYLVYAFKTTAGELVSHTCSRTKDIHGAGAEMRQLPGPAYEREE